MQNIYIPLRLYHTGIYARVDSMEKIDINKAKEVAKKKKLKPGIVEGTNIIQFTKGNNKRIKEIDWQEFERLLKERKLSIYESKGWMKIMSR